MPLSLHRSKDGEKQEAHTNTLVAEIGSMTLEFTRLSQITGDMRYYDAVQRITNHFDDQQMQTKLPGMWPVTVNARDIDFRSDTWYTLGAMSDSLYEYLPKQHLLLGGVTDQYRKLYERASAVFSIHNFYKPMTKDDANILFSAGVRSESATSTPVPDASMQHLVCFSGGMVALASRIFDHPSDLSTARSLTDGCIWAYKSLPHGLMSEVSHHIPCANSSGPCPWVESDWHSAVLSHDPNPPAEVPSADQSASMLRSSRLPPGYARIDDARYILRPEAIESVFILYRITGDVAYRDAAWDMFCAIENATRTAIAHAALDDILVDPPRQADRMESFWMAETLKYFYLIFTDPGVVSLDEWVFNTEAHPFRREGNGEH